MGLLNNIIDFLGRSTFIALAVIILLLLIFFLFYRSFRLRNLKNDLKEQVDRLNAIDTLPISYRLKRVKNIVKNMPDYIDSYDGFASRFEDLVKLKTDKIKPLINDLEDILDRDQIRGTSTKINNLKQFLNTYDRDSNQLLSEIEEITEIENQERLKIIKIKEKYRSTVDRFATVRYSIEEYVPNLSKDFTSIDQKFVDLEYLMNNQKFLEVQKFTTEISDQIDVLDVNVTNLPSYVSSIKNYFPKKIEKLDLRVEKLKNLNFSLERLNTSTRVGKIKHDLETTTNLVRNVDLVNVENNVKVIEDEINSLNNDFDLEEEGYKLFNSKKEHVYKHVAKLDTLLEQANLSYEELNDSYLLDNYETTISEDLTSFGTVLEDLAHTTEVIKSGDFSYIDVNNQLDEIENSCSYYDKAIKDYSVIYDSIKLQEKRAFDELDNINIVLLETKSEIKNRHLPMIDDSYKDYIEDSYRKADEIQNFIKEKPLDLEILSAQVDAARDIIYKLYDNVHNLIVTAEMVEEAIVYGNRFRSSFLQVNTELTKSEILYRNGEYTKALTTAVNILEKVKPGAYEQLLAKK